LSIAEIRAFDALASGSEPVNAEYSLDRLARLGYLNATGWLLDSDDEIRSMARRRYKIPVSLHIEWCEWVSQRAKRSGH
jgi:hypothetical protein